ncbi:MAG: hypothetical protein K6F84_02270, partial [Lachnospiraceae bacterium]|nr:hypothetical protein [Lachnospiraceae bacterium]
KDSGDEDLKDIHNMLEKSDNNETLEDDMISLLESIDKKDEQKEGEEANGKKSKKKKNGFFRKLLNLLTEEEPEETVQESENSSDEIKLSDENKEILENAEGVEVTEKGKKKKKKSKKGKKGKEEAPKPEGEDENAEEAEPKGKKKKKPKKEKPPKPEEPQEKGKKLSFKKVLPIFMLGVAIFFAIFILGSLGSDFAVKKAGRVAYINGDYESCYQNLLGKKLNENEKVMFNRSHSILWIRVWMREYEMFVEEGDEYGALDILIQNISEYSSLYEYASQWNASSDVEEVYNKMVDILNDKYGLSVEEALEIDAIKRDVDYSKAVKSVIDGEYVHTSQNDLEEESQVEPDRPADFLPEEEEFYDDSNN